MISVVLVYSPHTRVVHEMALRIPVGSTVAHALERSGAILNWNLEEIDDCELGVWGRKAKLGQLLRENDRIEIYRPLHVDPKVARRERYLRQGARSTGLFAKRRAGAKSGY